MIVLDSSAILAIVKDEPEGDNFLRVIENSGGCLISAVTILETRMVVRGRFGLRALAELSHFITEIDPEIVAFDRDQATVAFAAFERYGKGMGTAAKLNLGDCVTYALAKISGFPLLFKGRDFSETDIVPAI